jgi:hypothetical protein
MKWTKSAILVVIAVLAISYVYSSTGERKLSNDVKNEKLSECTKLGSIDCDLISKYHDECFKASYRAELKIRQLHRDEYNSCIDSKINQPINSNLK